MKSFTRNQSSIPGLRADKRFDALVKKQEGEHQHIISCHHKEMQALRDSLCLAMEKFQSLFQLCEKELKDFKELMVCNLGILKQKLIDTDSIISEQRKMIQSLNEQIQSLCDVYATKIDIEKRRNDLSIEIKENTKSHIDSFQEFQREFKTLINVIQNDLVKLRRDAETKISKLNEISESNFYVSRLEKEGVLKEIRIWEKTIFIIEKKIENIYTLIQRLNERGEICHKPE